MDLIEFAKQQQEWLQTLKKETFGIILPDGWLGRPYDNQHRVKDISVSSNVITIIFDDLRELKIVDPKKFQFKDINPNWSSLKFSECKEVILIWIPYGEEHNGKCIKKVFSQENSTVELIGYFSVSPSKILGRSDVNPKK